VPYLHTYRHIHTMPTRRPQAVAASGQTMLARALA